MKKLKNKQGSILISALLIFLTSITVSLTLSNSGLFNNARNARQQYDEAYLEEEAYLTNVEHFVNDVKASQQ